MTENPVSPDCRGQDFFAIDPDLDDLLRIYLSPEAHRHFGPHFRRLGLLAGGRLDELADRADKCGPVLHVRDRFGRNEDWIEYDPAYREMESIAFYNFGLHAMSHRPGVLDWPSTAPATVKYAFQYLFVQAEFGLMCPVSVTDTSAFLINRYGNETVRARFADITSMDPVRHLKGAQFMTERAGGSDISRSSLTARFDGTHWRLHGDKWFCSHADADVALLLARPEGAPAGTAGLGLFALPRRLDDGSRNGYRIVRLKDKLGTRSMASGEIEFDGAVAHPLGDLDRGLKQMMDQVNLSRLSHGVRAAAMMRRCLNEALAVARGREAFGRTVIGHPLMRRQLMKIALPTEQALSMWLHTARQMEAAQAGDGAAAKCLRLMTALLKFRACRDNVTVATASMEARGGNGYIEEWVNARLVRDAQIGVLWEGTSNINAIDIVVRAVGRDGAHLPLRDELRRDMDGVPGQIRSRIDAALDRAFHLAETVAGDGSRDRLYRKAASGLYHAVSAAVMAGEAARIGKPRRLRLAEQVVAHRLTARDPLGLDTDLDAGEADILQAA